MKMKMKAKAGTTPKFSHTYGSGLKQVAPNEHVKNGDTIVSSTSGRHVQVGGGSGSLKKREPEECCGGCCCENGSCPACN